LGEKHGVFFGFSTFHSGITTSPRSFYKQFSNPKVVSIKQMPKDEPSQPQARWMGEDLGAVIVGGAQVNFGVPCHRFHP